MSTGLIPRNMLKLVMLGDGGVGKTALVIQLCLHKFVETYDPTIEDSYRKQLVLDDQSTTLEVMDTAGQDEFDNLRDMWIRDGEGFFLVYSITQRMSFARVKQYYSEILSIKDGEPFGAILVGNKIDQNGERQVLIEEGQALADEWGVPFFETSAKMDINTETAFRTLAQTTRNKCEEHELSTASANNSKGNSFDTEQTSDAAAEAEVQKLPSRLSPVKAPSDSDASNSAEMHSVNASALHPPRQSATESRVPQSQPPLDPANSKVDHAERKAERIERRAEKKVERREKKKKHKCCIM